MADLEKVQDILQSHVAEIGVGVAALTVAVVLAQSLSNDKHITRAPVFSYLFSAVSGRFNLKDEGPIGLVWAGYRKLGDIFRLKVFGKNVTMLIGADASSVMYSANDSEVSSKELYHFTVPVFGKNIVYDCPTHIMAQQLKWVRHGLGTQLMETYCGKIAEEAVQFFNAWPDEGECDLHEEMCKLTILSASRCLLGDEIRANVDTQFGPYYQALSDGMSHVSVFFPYLPTKAHRERDEARKKIRDMFLKVIQKRRKNESHAEDYLQMIIDSSYRDGRKSSDEEIIGIMIATLFGGQHTSAISSTWMGLMIAKHKDTMLSRYLDEQTSVLSEHDGKLSVACVDSMELLHNSVKEVLRLFPPLIMLGRKVLKPLKYKEYDIAPGDILVTCPSVTHRLSDVFAKPDEFDPDRFFEPRKEDRQKFAYQPFGGGRHMCLGNRFGYLQIKIVMSVFLRMFDFELKDPNWVPKINYEAIVAGPVHTSFIKFKRKPKAEQLFL